MQKYGVARAVSSSLKKLFSPRNIIIVSEHKIGHHQVGVKSQLLVGTAVIGFFSLISYMSGSYMAAQSMLNEKEKKIQEVSKDKNRIDEEFALLKRDLSKLRQNGKELSEYSQFILDKHFDDGKNPNASVIGQHDLLNDGQSPLVARISFLENRIDEIKSENEQLVSAIRERTEDKMELFEDIINTTGLNISTLEKQVTLKPRVSAAVDSPKEEDKQRFDNQGGPFVPFDSTSFSDEDKELLGNMDRLAVLHNIVKALPIEKPIKNAQEMSPFGRRIDPFTGRSAMHTGIDLSAPEGAKIYAPNDGKVVAATRKGAYGNMVDIDHGLGLVTRFGHLSQILVQEGDKVRKGQIIGVQGSTGRSTGSHLHYEVRYNNIPLNPAKFLKAGDYVSQK